MAMNNPVAIASATSVQHEQALLEGTGYKPAGVAASLVTLVFSFAEAAAGAVEVLIGGSKYALVEQGSTTGATTECVTVLMLPGQVLEWKKVSGTAPTCALDQWTIGVP